MHSATLVTMAFDYYVAIRNPLRYATILSNTQIAKLGLVGLIRAVLFILPLLLSQRHSVPTALSHTRNASTWLWRRWCVGTSESPGYTAGC
ncbi:unnamed protein product [Eretmochelys imbricata]